MTTFTAQVDDWVLKTKERMEAVFREGVQITFNQVLDRWPRDTGFSYASFGASKSGPVPLVSNPYPSQKAQGQGPLFSSLQEPFTLVLAQTDLGEAIYGTFGANYAQYVEADVGAVALAAQSWQANVNLAVQMAKNSVRR